MLNIFCFCFWENKDIVKVHDNEFVKIPIQNSEDKSLKRYRCISESEQYNLVFVVSELSPKYRFLFVSFFNSKLVVYVSDVVFAIIFRSLNNILNFVD
jgi:hypothetical protein